MKLDVDTACVKKKSRIGFGAIIRNDKGSFLSAAMEVLRSQLSIFGAEA